VKEMKEMKEVKEMKEMKEVKEMKEMKEVKEMKEMKEVKEMRRRAPPHLFRQSTYSGCSRSPALSPHWRPKRDLFR
jgi:hypothetical protein